MTYHLYAIGNALVDTEYEVSDAQLQAAGVEKRHMTLIDAARRTELLKHVHNVKSHRTGGGSAGNTVVALAQLGGRAFYSCRVADDELGDFYTKDLLSHGVATNLTHTKPPQGQTGSCMVMVTPDAERSMSTFWVPRPKLTRPHCIRMTSSRPVCITWKVIWPLRHQVWRLL